MISAPKVIRELDRITSQRDYATKLQLYNSPKLISVALEDCCQWAEAHGVLFDIFQSGQPNKKSFFERFYRIMVIPE